MSSSRKPIEQIQYFEDHNAPWSTNAVAIGTSTSDVTDLATKTAAARAAYDAQQTARQASENATHAFKTALAVMNASGEDILAKIRGQAKKTANPNVYTLAQVTPPAPRTPATPPGKPTDFKVQISTNGFLSLKWKNTNATGCVYMIYRRLGATGNFQQLAGVGEKKFTDTTVPAGTLQVQYQIQAVRSTGASDFEQFNVSLGVEAGTPTATVTVATPVKMAA